MREVNERDAGGGNGLKIDRRWIEDGQQVDGGSSAEWTAAWKHADWTLDLFTELGATLLPCLTLAASRPRSCYCSGI